MSEQNHSVPASPSGSQASPEAAFASSPPVSIPNAEEHRKLRDTLRTIIRHCGGGAHPSVSNEFLCLAADEVKLALIAAERRGFEHGRALASAIDARRAETAQTGSVHESAAPSGETPHV